MRGHSLRPFAGSTLFGRSPSVAARWRRLRLGSWLRLGRHCLAGQRVDRCGIPAHWFHAALRHSPYGSGWARPGRAICRAAASCRSPSRTVRRRGPDSRIRPRSRLRSCCWLARVRNSVSSSSLSCLSATIWRSARLHLAFHRIDLEGQDAVKVSAHQQDGSPADRRRMPVMRLSGSWALVGAGAAVRVAARRWRNGRGDCGPVRRRPGRTAFATSAKVGTGGRGGCGQVARSTGPAPLASRRNCLTMRSSRLWKLTTASRRRGPAAPRRRQGRRPARPARRSHGCGSPGSCGWPDPSARRGGGRAPCAPRGQLAGGRQRAGGDDRAGDAARLALLAIVIEHVGDRRIRRGVEEIGGAFAFLAHPHVERAVGEKAKPRPAWSSCIEDTPMSITTPSTCATPASARPRPFRKSGAGGARGGAVLPWFRAIGARRRWHRDRGRRRGRSPRHRAGAGIAAGAEGGIDHHVARHGSPAPRSLRQQQNRPAARLRPANTGLPLRAAQVRGPSIRPSGIRMQRGWPVRLTTL
jgi:hypothetical protein